MELFIQFGQNVLTGSFRFPITYRTLEQLLINNNTFQWRRSFQWSIFHITGFITEDCSQQFFLRTRIGLSFRGNLTNQDISRLNTSPHANDSVFIQILRGLLTYVRNISRQLFQSTFRFTNFQRILVHVNRCKDIIPHDILGDHDSILVVVSFPRHECHFQVPSECQFSLFWRVSFRQYLTFFHTLTFSHDRFQRDRRTLVCTLVFRQVIFFRIRFKAYKSLFLRTVIFNNNLASVNKRDHSRSLCDNLRSGILNQISLQTGSHDRGLRGNNRNCLTHHVRSHQRSVGIIMLQERDQRRRDRCNLIRGNIDQIDILSGCQREVRIFSGFYPFIRKLAIFIDSRTCLSNYQLLLFLCRIVAYPFLGKIHDTIIHLTVRSFDKS